MLYIVATPIGNLGDVTLRAIETLKSCSFVMAENPLYSKRLLEHIGAWPKPVIQFAEHNEQQILKDTVRRLSKEDGCLISDAGTPGISDPGFRLVRECVKENVQVVPIPGANAAIAALCASGLPTDKFLFLGFLQKTAAKTISALQEAANGATAGEMKEVVYEGYGPFGTAFLVEAVTNNSNRSFNNVRKIFSDHGGSTGAQGSVAWQFSTKGQILVERDANIETIEMAAIDAGADDVRESQEGLEVYTTIETLQKVKDALIKAGAKIAQAEIIKESSQGTDLTDEQKPAVDKLFEALEQDEDVIAVHTSANL